MLKVNWLYFINYFLSISIRLRSFIKLLFVHAKRALDLSIDCYLRMTPALENILSVTKPKEKYIHMTIYLVYFRFFFELVWTSVFGIAVFWDFWEILLTKYSAKIENNRLKEVSETNHQLMKRIQNEENFP